jgi:hypothetical protein
MLNLTGKPFCTIIDGYFDDVSVASTVCTPSFTLAVIYPPDVTEEPPWLEPAAVLTADPTPISDEVLLVLSAAVAAFLGERAHVRQVRLVHSDAWAQQGRVSVMASHRWAVHR